MAKTSRMLDSKQSLITLRSCTKEALQQDLRSLRGVCGDEPLGPTPSPLLLFLHRLAWSERSTLHVFPRRLARTCGTTWPLVCVAWVAGKLKLHGLWNPNVTNPQLCVVLAGSVFACLRNEEVAAPMPLPSGAAPPETEGLSARPLMRTLSIDGGASKLLLDVLPDELRALLRQSSTVVIYALPAHEVCACL